MDTTEPIKKHIFTEEQFINQEFGNLNESLKNKIANRKSLNESKIKSIKYYFDKYVGTDKEMDFWEIVSQYYTPDDDGESEYSFLENVKNIDEYDKILQNLNQEFGNDIIQNNYIIIRYDDHPNKWEVYSKDQAEESDPNPLIITESVTELVNYLNQ